MVDTLFFIIGAMFGLSVMNWQTQNRVAKLERLMIADAQSLLRVTNNLMATIALLKETRYCVSYLAAHAARGNHVTPDEFTNAMLMGYGKYPEREKEKTNDSTSH